LSVQEIYDSLWETMARDFEVKLDAPTFNEFESKVSDWAGIHSSEATQSVGVAIWNTLHEPTIAKIEDYENHYRDRFTGRFRTKADFEAQSKK